MLYTRHVQTTQLKGGWSTWRHSLFLFIFRITFIHNLGFLPKNIHLTSHSASLQNYNKGRCTTTKHLNVMGEANNIASDQTGVPSMDTEHGLVTFHSCGFLTEHKSPGWEHRALTDELKVQAPATTVQHPFWRSGKWMEFEWHAGYMLEHSLKLVRCQCLSLQQCIPSRKISPFPQMMGPCHS